MTTLIDTTDLLTGVVVAVSTRPVSTALAEDAVAGATTITVVDNATILPGETLRLTDPDDPEQVETVAVDDLDGIDRVLLSTPLSASYPATARVSREPAALETVASVSFDDDSEPLPVPVAHALGDALLRGIRDSGSGELVRVDRVGGELRIVDILGRGPVVDGDFVLTPGTGLPLGQTLQDIYDTADEIAEAAQEAANTGTAAQQTADGKNTVTYSADPPGTTPNKAGDVWFQRTTTPQSPTRPVIIAQFEGQGGTTWESVKLSGLTIAYIDAGIITAGSAFVNALSVLTNFTLGGPDDNGNIVDGVIQTYDFANPAQTKGVLISRALGVVAKGATLAGSLIVGSVIEGGTLSVGTPGGTEIFLSTATDPFGVTGAWAIQDFRIAQGWNAGRLWATYNPSDPYISTSAGILKVSSPYVGSSISNAAVMQLMAGGNGSSYATFDAGTVALRSNRMRFESRNSSAFDVVVENTPLLQFVTPGGEKLGINFAATGSGFGAISINSRLPDGNLKQLMLQGQTLYLNSGDGVRNLTIGGNYSFPNSPFIVDAGADVGISFRNITLSNPDFYPNGIAGVLDVVGAAGNNFKLVRAWDFIYMSDQSFKAAVKNAPPGMLDQIRALRPVRYGVRGFRARSRQTLGLIAQEVAEAIPGATVGEDGEMGINSYYLITTLIGAVQELAAQVDQLRAVA